MLVILKTDGDYTEFEDIAGKKVIARQSPLGGFDISLYELNRVSSNDISEITNLKGRPMYFFAHEVEVVQPKLVNCTDKNIGKGWS